MALPHQAIEQRFTYHPPPGPDIAELHDGVRYECKRLAHFINSEIPGDSREKSLALTAVQEAMMWANAHVAVHISTQEVTDAG